MAEMKTPQKDDKITVLNPACSSTRAERVPLAPRHFTSLDDKTMITEFLDAMGWDRRTMAPSKAKLKELGLEDISV